MYESNRERREGDRVILTLGEEELEKCIADMEDISAKCLKDLKTEPRYTEAERVIVRGEIIQLYDVALTAMRMVWLQMQGEQVEVTG